MKVQFAVVSEQNRRSNNEDQAFAGPLETAAGEKIYVCAVADGVGGVDGGELGSELVVRELQRCIQESSANTPDALMKDLANWAKRCNEQIASLAAKTKKQPFTTFSGGFVFSDYQIVVAHIGDSRLCSFTHEESKQLTADHTHAAKAEASGSTKSELTALDYRTLTKCFDGQPTTEVDIHKLSLESDFCGSLVATSDGVHDAVNLFQMHAITTAATDPEEMAAHLTRAAMQQGASDNSTAAVLTIGNWKGTGNLAQAMVDPEGTVVPEPAPVAMIKACDAPPAAPQPSIKAKSGPSLGVILLIAGILILVAAVVAGVVLSKSGQATPEPTPIESGPTDNL